MNQEVRPDNLLDQTSDCSDIIEWTTVYVDGACKDNGRKNARGSIGVYWGEDDLKNVSEKIDLKHKQTNGVAELLAVIKSIEQAIEFKIDNLIIKSDNKYVTDAANEWIKNWVNNGWKLKDGNDVKHKHLWEHFLKMRKNINYQLVFVRRDTEEGNKEADKLANSALDSKINADNDEHKIKDTVAPEDYCPKCKHEVKTSGVWCIKCKNWWHFRCDRTNSEEVKKKFRDSDYVCKMHEEREGFIENMSQKNDIITKLKNKVKLFKEEKYNSQNLINTKDQEIRKLNENVVGTNRENVKLNKKISD